MPQLADIRQKYPQYNDMSDQQLADAFHGKYYADIPKDEFYQKIGYAAEPLVVPKEEGFLSNLGKDIEARKLAGKEISDAYAQGKQGLGESLFQTFGKVGMGAINDVVGEGIAAGGRGISFITPDIVKKKLGEAGSYLADTAPVVAAKEGFTQLGEGYNQFAQSNPRAARNIESVANIATALPAGKLAEESISLGASGLSKVGNKIEGMGIKQAADKRTKFISELVAPKETAKVAEDQIGRTVESGLFNKREVVPTPRDIETYDVLSTLPLSPKKTLLGNHNVIKEQIGKEAEALVSDLQKNDVFFPRKEFKAQFQTVMKNLEENPFLGGNPEGPAKAIIEKMGQLIDKNKASASGVLNARKQLDKWVTNLGREKAFDPATENAISAALREVRQVTNDFVDSKVSNVDVKRSLRRQSLMFGALENIAPKAAEEAKTATGRLVQKVAKKVPLKTDLGKAAAIIAGTGIAGGAAAMLPGAALGAAGIYGAGKALNSSILKKAVGKTLKTTGNVAKRSIAEALTP